MRDKIAQRRVHEARDRFVAAINEDDILRLASAHHNGDACTFFKLPVRGSYNICYFVRFRGDKNCTGGQQQVNDGEKARDAEPGAPGEPTEGCGKAILKGLQTGQEATKRQEHDRVKSTPTKSDGCGSTATTASSSKDGLYARQDDLWVVRVPLDPYLCFPAYEKVEGEVAVMR